MEKKTVGIIAFVVGLIIFLAGIIATGVILTVAPDQLKTSAQMKVAGETGYDAFVDTRHEDATPLYYDYTFYSIDNADEIANTPNNSPAPAPKVTPQGPYVYREYCTKHELQFEDDEQEVKFKELCWKVFQPDLSKDALTGAQLHEADSVTLPYFSYYGLLNQKKAAANAPVFLMAAFAKVMGGLIAAANGAGFSNAALLANWAAETDPATSVRQLAQAKGMNLNFEFELNLFRATSTAASIFRPTDPTILTPIGEKLIFGTGGKGILQNCLLAVNTPGPCTAYFLTMASKFSQAIAAGPDGLAEASAIADLFVADYAFPTSPDTATKLTIVGGYIQFFATYIQYMIGSFFGQAFAETQAFVGTDATKAYDMFAPHFFSKRNVRKQLFSLLNDPFASVLQATAAGGLFAYSECPKTFKAFGEDNTGDFPVEACTEEWKTTTHYNEVFGQRTGRKDITEVEMMTQWRSLAALPKQTWSGPDSDIRGGYWCKDDAPVVGRRNPNNPSASNHLTKWEMNPVVNKDYTLHIFNPDTLRDVTFGYHSDSSVRGVNTLKFGVKPENIDPVAAQEKNGNIFEINHAGVFDMTCTKGTSIMLTFPNYYNSSYLERDDVILPEGMRQPEEELDAVFLDIEPLTGKTINARFQLLINLQVPTGIPGFTGAAVPISADNTDAKHIVFPIVTMNKHSTLSSKDADKLKAVNMALVDAPKPVLIVACIFGPLFMAIGIFLIVTASKSAATVGSSQSGVELQSKADVTSSTAGSSAGTVGHVMVAERT